MDTIPYGRIHFRMLFIMTILQGSFGAAFTADALGLSTLQQVYSISDIESGGMVSAIAVGLLVMCPIAGLLSDSIGRKKVIVVGLFVSFVACFLKSFVPSFQWQITLRIFQGAAAACVWVPTPVMMAEMMPKHVRGPLTIFYSIGWPIFSGFSALLGFFLLPSGKQHADSGSSAGSSVGSSAQGVVSGSLVEEGWLGLIGWQWYFLISSLPLLVAAVLVYKFIYESPRYHAAIGRHATAKQLVEDLYAMNGHSRPEVLSVVSWKNGGAHPYRSNQPPTTQMLPWDRLCCSSSTLGLYAVWICKAGGSWGAAFWMPTYVERRIKLDALNEIKHTVGETYYVNTLSSTTPYRLLVFQSLCDAVGIALAALLINKVGRRLSLQASFLCAGCALLLLTMVTGEIAVLLMSGTMQFAQAIAWVVLVLHTAESFATSIRTTAMGFASTAARIGAIGAPIICGTWGWFVGVLSFLLLLACFLIVWDVCFF